MYYETKPGPREQSRAGTESRRKVKVCRFAYHLAIARGTSVCADTDSSGLSQLQVLMDATSAQFALQGHLEG